MSEPEPIYWTNEKRKLSDLIPWDINPAQIGKDEARRLEESLDQFGQVHPIAISPDNEIYDGHQRKAVWGASKKFGQDYEVDVRVSSRELTEQERKKLVIYLRKGTVGTFDFDILANNFELDDLLEWGFERKELDLDLWAGEPAEDPGAQIDRAEELREKWGVELGQLWQLGEHRLICGDCTDAAVVKRVMGGEKAELMFTSPPYADMREYSGNDLSIETLVMIFPIWGNSTNYFVINLGIQFKNDEVYEYWDYWIAAARASGLKFLSWNVWDRINATSVSHQTKMFAITHEWVIVFGKQTKEINRTWDKSKESKAREKYYRVNGNGQKVTTRRQPDGSVKDSVIGTIYDNKNMGTVFTGYAEMERNIDHPARFPIEFPFAYIGAMTNHDDIVSDPFLGSGTTLIACERLGRKCRAVEISPAYCAVAIQRWFDMTGGEPVLVD